MADFTILQQGNVYFLYRPKVQYGEAHHLEEVQRFFMVLKPVKMNRYIFIIIGRKHLPEREGESYLAIVDSIKEKFEDFLNSLGEVHYETQTRGERKVPPVRILGEGKYMIVVHDNHSHLIYQLQSSTQIGQVQEEFNLEEKGDFLIAIKNPTQPSPPGVGLSLKEKAQYPEYLMQKFNDYRFISLICADFLNYESAELLLIEKKKAKIMDENLNLQDCFSKIPEENISKLLEVMEGEQPIEPLLKGTMT